VGSAEVADSVGTAGVALRPFRMRFNYFWSIVHKSRKSQALYSYRHRGV
jgi:hypothetical protein